MRLPTQPFRRGERPILGHLNEGIVRPLNEIRGFSGDQFISVVHAGGTVAFGLNVETLLPWVRRASGVVMLAEASANYAWLDEDNPDLDNPGEFCLRYVDDGGVSDGTERRAVIHADRHLGGTTTIAQLVIDLQPDEAPDGDGVKTLVLWRRDYSVPGAGWGITAIDVGKSVSIEIHPSLVDFDPTDITWNDAYVNGGPGGGLGLFDLAAQGDEGNLGDAATIAVAQDAKCHLVFSAADPGAPFVAGSAGVEMQTELPDLMAVKLSDCPGGGLLDTWNGYPAVYGFEVRVKTGTKDTMTWQAGGLDSPDSVVYVLRKSVIS